MAQFEVAVVIDNGSGVCKAGCEDGPRNFIPSMVGRPRHKGIMLEVGQKMTYVGDAAQAKRDVLSIKRPIERGVIKNSDDMEQLWDYAISSMLCVQASEHAILMTESAFSPKEEREMSTEIMFEKFGAPAFYLIIPAILSFHMAKPRKNTGIVIDSGYGVTHAVPILEGHALRHAACRLDFAGQDLTDLMEKELAQKLSQQPDVIASLKEVISDVKEKACSVTLDWDQEMQLAEQETSYELPDGQTIMIGKERFSVPEALFQPALHGLSGSSIHQLLYNSILKCDVDMHQDLFRNIVLSGGTTMFPGFQPRMLKEMTHLGPTGMMVKVVTAPYALNSAWIGGSILASQSTFERLWCSRQEYDDVGPSIIHRKCF